MTRQPLSRTLVVWVVMLFLAVTAATGTATVLVMQRLLTHQVDEQLTQMSRVQNERPNGPPERTGEAPPPGTGEGYVHTVITADGLVVQNYVVRNGTTSSELDDGQLTALKSLTPGQIATVSLGALGRYRAVAVERDALVAADGQVEQVRVISVSALPLSGVNSTVAGLVRYVVVFGTAGLILVAVVGTWAVRRSLRPLRRVAATAHEVSRLRLDSGEVALATRVPGQDTDPRTEVGRVGNALNLMLDNVATALTARHESELRVRRFVADASHELRTPLSSIRGYVELSLRERGELPAEVGHALTRVESEADRMSGLVEDLLLLARLDEGRPLESVPVDLSALVVECLADARAVSPDHRWELDLPAEPLSTRGDGGRLRQVLLNLLTNARTHTPPGTSVRVGLRRDGAHVLLTVADNGPGVPADLQSEVFQRFARGDGSRNRAAGSTGLGLAIVQAVVEAHGGTVTMDSTPGRTVFSVRLTAA